MDFTVIVAESLGPCIMEIIWVTKYCFLIMGIKRKKKDVMWNHSLILAFLLLETWDNSLTPISLNLEDRALFPLLSPWLLLHPSRRTLLIPNPPRWGIKPFPRPALGFIPPLGSKDDRDERRLRRRSRHQSPFPHRDPISPHHHRQATGELVSRPSDRPDRGCGARALPRGGRQGRAGRSAGSRAGRGGGGSRVCVGGAAGTGPCCPERVNGAGKLAFPLPAPGAWQRGRRACRAAGGCHRPPPPRPPPTPGPRPPPRPGQGV